MYNIKRRKRRTLDEILGEKRINEVLDKDNRLLRKKLEYLGLNALYTIINYKGDDDTQHIENVRRALIELRDIMILDHEKDTLIKTQDNRV